MKLCLLCDRKFQDTCIYCPYDGRELTPLSADESMIGRLIENKYKIEFQIARGGTGTVYRALHLQLNVPVAIKVLHSDRINDVTAVERFRREAFAAMQVRHPHAIAVYDFGVTMDHLVYVVMELLSGVTLRQRLKRQCYLSLLEINDVMQQMCAAVAVAHKRNIVHRDLKPENVFMHTDGDQEVVRVLDFGLAKLRGLLGEDESMIITRDGLVLGTPLYMSPEQSRGRPVSKRSDIYSLGVILYEMLTGQLPFRGSSLTNLAIKHATERPRPIYEVRPNLPHVVNAVVMHALEKSPQQRPASVIGWAAELEAAIKAVTEGEFRCLFLGAGDQDLEAAVLLTGEPGHLPSISQPAPPDSGNLFMQFPENSSYFVDEVTTSPVDREPATGSPVYNALTVGNEHVEGMDNKFAVKTESNYRLTETDILLPRFSPEEIEQMRERLLGMAKETSMLLQIIIGDLTANTPLDRVFFDEFDVTVQTLRESMAHLKKAIGED